MDITWIKNKQNWRIITKNDRNGRKLEKEKKRTEMDLIGQIKKKRKRKNWKIIIGQSYSKRLKWTKIGQNRKFAKNEKRTKLDILTVCPTKCPFLYFFPNFVQFWLIFSIYPPLPFSTDLITSKFEYKNGTQNTKKLFHEMP